jgi:anti-sigma28 factor (negative regulator of flagellin synthesis)
MSRRVSQDAISTPALSQPGGADATTAIGKARRNPSPEAAKARRDSVDLSSLSERIAEAGRRSDAARAGRVRQLAAVYAAGQYHTEAQNVSRAMIDEALGRNVE